MVRSEALWTIRTCRLFTWRQANYLLQQCLSFVLQWISLLKRAPLLSCPTCGVQYEARSSLYALWCGIIWDEEGGKSLWTSSIIIYLSTDLLCADDGGMFSVIVHCIRSGWPSDKAPFCDIMSVKKVGDEEKMRGAWCQNVLKHSKGRQRPLCCVCIKTRAHSPAIISPASFKLLCGLKKLEIQETGLFVNNDIFPTQEFLSGHLDFIITLSS